MDEHVSSGGRAQSQFAAAAAAAAVCSRCSSDLSGSAWHSPITGCVPFMDNLLLDRIASREGFAGYVCPGA